MRKYFYLFKPKKKIINIIFKLFRINRADEKSSNTILNVFDSFISLFILVWFICGNIWIYSIMNEVKYNKNTNNEFYCSKTTYLFSFWLVTSIYILVGLGCFVFCFTICLTIFIPAKN